VGNIEEAAFYGAISTYHGYPAAEAPRMDANQRRIGGQPNVLDAAGLLQPPCRVPC